DYYCQVWDINSDRVF
nr:immunoglobulin light chain junction region [Macaca mulatta]